MESGEAGSLWTELEAFVRHCRPEASDVSVTGIARAGGGSSTKNWFFDAHWSVGGEPRFQPLILRRAPAHEIVLATREDEFRLLQALGPTDVPTPSAYWMDTDGRWLQRPAMVLGRCEGVVDRGVLTDGNRAGLSRGQRRELALQLPEILAAIHSLDVDALDLPANLARSAGNPAELELDLQERECRNHEDEPCIELRLTAWSLHETLPPPPRRKVLVHGDFRPENLMVKEGRISAVLDWELAHVGDPAEDLGWYLAPNYRGEHLIEGNWTEEDFLMRYEAASGGPVDRSAVSFWKLFALYKLSGIALATVNAFVKGDAGRLALLPRRLLEPMLQMVAIDTAKS